MSVLDKMNQKGTVIVPSTTGIDDGVNTNVDNLMDDGLSPVEDYDEVITTLESIHAALTKMGTPLGEISQDVVNASAEAYKGVCLAFPKLCLESEHFNPFLGVNYEHNKEAYQLTKTMLYSTVCHLKDKRGQLC